MFKKLIEKIYGINRNILIDAKKELKDNLNSSLEQIKNLLDIDDNEKNSGEIYLFLSIFFLLFLLLYKLIFIYFQIN